MEGKHMGQKDFLKEPDKIETFSNTMLQFVLRYKKHIIGGICIVIAAVSLWAANSYFSGKAEARALAAIYEVYSRHQVLSRDAGPSAAYNAVKNDFERALDEYSGRKAVRIARVIYAGICYDSGQFDRALELYQKALTDFGQEPYKSMMLSGIAYSFEAKKDYKNAAAHFERIVSEGGALMKSEALFGLGRLYELSGDIEKSRSAYQRLVADDPESIYLEAAREKISG